MEYHRTMSSLLLSAILWIGPTFLNPAIGLSYESRIEIRPNGLKIKPLLAAPSGNDPHHYLWMDTSVFDKIGLKPSACPNHEDTSTYCLQWQDKAHFKITKINEHCELHEMSTELPEPLSLVIGLEGVHLYGGTEMSNQTWPTQKSSLNGVPYVTRYQNSQCVLERYWLDSAGHYIYVDRSVPLFLTQNETTLLLTAEIREPYIRKTNKTILKYRYCTFDNVKLAHLDAIANVFTKPTRLPDCRMVRYPIWSTWAVYSRDVNERKVYEYASMIERHNLPNSALEIDDRWEICYGSLTVDTERFPDMRRHVRDLKALGFRVTLWAHPFINEGCEPTYSIARQAGYLVKSENGSLHTRWWNGDAAIIDFTNPAAAQWFANRLKKVQEETGVDSFKFDAGESSYSPQAAVYANMSDDHPDTYIRAYVETLNQFGKMIEIRVASGVQDIAPVVRMEDRNTRWSGPLGFETMIPTLLQMNIVGYPFVMPDMIGGNAYSDDVLSEELYLRWLQLSIFMPIVQFSLPPWVFSSGALETTKKFIALHAEYADMIFELMEKSVQDGTPVNLPLWWIDPDDRNTYEIDSEFLLGENILVAPVVKQGAKMRDIYVPRGQWKDENNPKAPTIEGPVMLENYKVGLDVLPYFTRVNYVGGSVLPIFSAGFLCFSTSIIFIALILKLLCASFKRSSYVTFKNYEYSQVHRPT